MFPFGVEYAHIEVGVGSIWCWGVYDRAGSWNWWGIWGVWLVGWRLVMDVCWTIVTVVFVDWRAALEL